MNSSTGLLLAALLSLLSTIQPAFANCYYPNGDVAEGMAACTSEGGTCCPLNWMCLSDGLCYLENAGYFGRYTCTSQDWASDSTCPNYCTQNYTAAGNEAIQHCADGSWCCDSNRDPKNNCCDSGDAEELDLGSGGSEIGFISSTEPPSSVTESKTSMVTMQTTRLTTTSSTSTSSTSTSTSAAPKATPTTVTTSAVTSNSAGVATTIISVITSTPTPTTTPTPAPASGGSNRSLVVGLGAGIPGAVLAAAAVGFLLWRLRRKRQLHEKPPLSEPPGLVSMYRTPDDTPELDSTLPAIKPDRKSELYGSTPAQLQHSPAISSMTAGSDPPYYSPTGVVGPGGALGLVQEEPSELWGGEIPAQQWPGQQPYRAPEPEQRMSQTFRVSQREFEAYRPPQPDGLVEEPGAKATQPQDY